MRTQALKKVSFITLILLSFACAVSPLGRKQLMLVPDSQMDQMGAQAFQEMKSTQPLENDPAINRYVNCIVTPLTQTSQSQPNVPPQWEVVVFKSPEANAFALPGGKIGVYTGILKVGKTDGQLAAVIGHEIGHVIARHGAERVSQQAGTEVGLAALGAITPDNSNKNLLLGLLGVGTQVGILLPFSRTQESEADLIGLDLMARAGFDPHQSTELWRNMMAAGGKGPPQWLSTHPAGETRINDLDAHMNEAVIKYDRARSSGHAPSCDRSQLKL